MLLPALVHFTEVLMDLTCISLLVIYFVKYTAISFRSSARALMRIFCERAQNDFKTTKVCLVVLP